MHVGRPEIIRAGFAVVSGYIISAVDVIAEPILTALSGSDVIKADATGFGFGLHSKLFVDRRKTETCHSQVFL